MDQVPKKKIIVSEELLSDAKYTCKTVTLQNRPDDHGRNRVVSYSECGNLETGHPVLLHYGILGSSLITVFCHEQALQFNLRLIAIDYPGIGESTTVNDRTLASWAADVEQFCHQVLLPQQHESISLVGHSLGGPHALAVWARLLASDRMTINIANLTLVAPWVGDADTNPWWMRYGVQTLPQTLQRSYFPSVAASLLVGSSYLTYPFRYVVPNEKQLLLRTVQQVHAYHRCQGSAGNRELVRLALEASTKSDFWDPLLAEIAVLCQQNEKDSTDQDTTTTTTPLVKSKKQMRVHVLQGSADTMVSPDACQKLVGWLQETGCQVEYTLMDKADHDTILLDSEIMATVFGSLQLPE